MAGKLTECSFLVPVHRDSVLSDGELQSADSWEWLKDQFWDEFDTPGTLAPGLHEGGYTDPDTGERVTDSSRKYILALKKSDVKKLRAILRIACGVFEQKCIYLSVGGTVEFVSADK